MQKRSVLGFALCAAIGSLLVATPAFAVYMDASLPIYPKAVPAGFTYSDPRMAKALQIGFAIFADTTDSTHTVDQWYRSHLPKACSRHTEAAGIQYSCSTGVVNIIVYHGKTRIAIVPDS